MRKLEGIKRAAAGHFLTKIGGLAFPMDGAPRQTSLWLMHPLKVIVRKILPDLATFYRQFAKTPEEMVPPVKEVWRLFDLLIERDTATGQKEFWESAQLLVCNFLEEDKAYLWRFLDVVNEADMSKFVPTENERYYMGRKLDYNSRIRQEAVE